MFTEEKIKDYANKLLFDLTDEEVSDLLSEFDTINENMEKIASIKDIDKVDILCFPQDGLTSNLRRDSETRTISYQDALSNCDDTYDDVVSVPKVVG